MNLKKTVATICAASAIVSVTPLQEAIANTLGQEGAKGPNFVNIVIDDMGFSDLGAFGGEINTPHLDELAGKGTILRNFYASPTSTPSRGMLFTGKDMHQVGTGNLVGWANSRPPQKGLSGYLGDMSEEALPFPELLQKNGYHTMMVGKWDLGSEAGRFPTDRGFDQSLVLVPGGDVHYITDDNGKIIRSRPPTQKCSDDTQKECTSYNENGEKFADFPKNAYATEFYTSAAIKMLEKWKQENALSSNPEPFYLNVSHIAPHSPFQAPANIIEEYELIYTKGWDIIRKERFDRLKELGFVSPEAQLPPRPKEIQAWYELSQEQQQIEAKRMAVYAAMIHVMDQQVGKLIDHLKEIGQYNNTVFLVLSDNGGAFVPTGGPQRSRDYRNDTFSGDCRSGVFDENSEKVSKKCREDYGNMGNASSFINPNHGWGTVANTPFNRYKGDTFEGGVHTAAFVYYPKWPNHLERVKKVDECLRSIMDIAPTILDMANIEKPPMDGRSMADLFSTSPKCCGTRWLAWEQDSVKGVVYHHYQDQIEKREGNWKLSQKWWETQSRWDPNWYLYDITTDPFEQNDLSRKRPDILKYLKGLYAQYAKDNGVVKVGSKVLPQLYPAPKNDNRKNKTDKEIKEQALIMGGVAIDYNNYKAQTNVHPKDEIEIDAVIRPKLQDVGKTGKMAVIVIPCAPGTCKEEGETYSDSDVRNYHVLGSDGNLIDWKLQQAGGIGNELPENFYKQYASLPSWIEFSDKEIQSENLKTKLLTGEHGGYDIILGYWLDNDQIMIDNKDTPIRVTWNDKTALKKRPTDASREETSTKAD